MAPAIAKRIKLIDAFLRSKDFEIVRGEDGNPVQMYGVSVAMATATDPLTYVNTAGPHLGAPFIVFEDMIFTAVLGPRGSRKVLRRAGDRPRYPRWIFYNAISKGRTVTNCPEFAAKLKAFRTNPAISQAIPEDKVVLVAPDQVPGIMA